MIATECVSVREIKWMLFSTSSLSVVAARLYFVGIADFPVLFICLLKRTHLSRSFKERLFSCALFITAHYNNVYIMNSK